MKKSKKNKVQEESTNVEQQLKDVLDSLENKEDVDSNSGVKDWEMEAQDLNEKYLRLYSEFDNYRKRTSRERLELLKSASADVLTELLPVADDFDRTLSSFEQSNRENHEALLQGIKLVQQKFMNVLDRQGLKFFESKEKDFDPDFHEAITKIPAPDKKLKGKVVDVIEKGYMLNEKVLRYAKVVVGE